MVARLYQYALPLNLPTLPQREGLILQWNDGWGEIAPLPGFSRETLAEARSEILSFLPHLAKAKPTLPSVQFGLACASAPFSPELLEPIDIPLCALNTPSPGCTAIKLKVGHLTLDAAIALAKQFQNQYAIRIDCNRAWTLDQALAFASHFKPTDFDYLEEPLQNFDDLIRFSRLTGFPIAADESISRFPIQEIPTLKAVVVKPTVLGGIPPSKTDLVFSSSYETGLGLLHIARLAKKYSSRPAGLDTYRFFANDILSSPIQTSAGRFFWKPNAKPLIDLSKLCLIASAP